MTSESETQLPSGATRLAITASLSLATLMITLDTTIANVALPHIQGSLSASADEIVWVLTSYMVATAMMTPVSGWFGDRFGPKPVFLVTIAGFTVCSMLCGMATTLPELVAFRIAQGCFGAFTMPLGQALLFNIYPPHRHAHAMSIWSAGAVLGPLLGPIVGGYITEAASWRWCFFINLPIGAVALSGMWLFMRATHSRTPRHFDFLGFAALLVATGALQLTLDRGPGQDWFSSIEIWIYAVVGAASFWVFLAHTFTTPNPFVDLAILRNPNFVSATVLSMVVTAVNYGSLALMPQLTQSVMDYPVLFSGIVNAPRGGGMMITMLLMPRLVRWFDPRQVMMAGLALSAFAVWQMSHFDLSMGSTPIVVTAFIQGLSQGTMMIPIAMVGFSTLRPQHRGEAAALYNLTRMLASSAAISSFQAMVVAKAQVMHASLAAHVTPSDPVFRSTIGRALSPGTVAGAEALNGLITRQATMVAFVDAFRLMVVMFVICAPLILLLRVHKTAPPQPAIVE